MRNLVGICECKRPLERQRHISEDNIKVDLTEVGYEGVFWIQLSENSGRFFRM